MKPSTPDADQIQLSEQDEEPPSSLCSIEVELCVDEAIAQSLDDIGLKVREIETAVRQTASMEGFSKGAIGVRITDDATIRQLNAKHLEHDYATDVISFGYETDLPHLEGELVASVDTARRQATSIQWPIKHELLLYIVHGVLHICGMDDHDQCDRAAMRAAEQAVFLKLGIHEISRCGADTQNDEMQNDETQNDDGQNGGGQ